MKKIFLSVVATTVLGLTINAQAHQTQSDHRARAAVDLFVQTAKAASLTPTVNANVYTLNLEDVNPLVLWFNDRPQRAAGTVGVQQFVAMWGTGGKNSFKLDHPNAAVVSVSIENDSSPKATAPVFSLSQPHYDSQKHLMSYEATLIKGSDKPLQMQLKDVAVFVDYIKWAPDIGYYPAAYYNNLISST